MGLPAYTLLTHYTYNGLKKLLSILDIHVRFFLYNLRDKELILRSQ